MLMNQLFFQCTQSIDCDRSIQLRTIFSKIVFDAKNDHIVDNWAYGESFVSNLINTEEREKYYHYLIGQLAALDLINNESVHYALLNFTSDFQNRVIGISKGNFIWL